MIPHEDYGLRDRLVNWGMWGRLGSGGPDSSCANPMYQQMIPPGPDEYGEVTAETVIVPQATEARPEREIDEADAESLDFTIRQLARGHRIALTGRYVLLRRPHTPEGKSSLTVARVVLQNALDMNRATVERMRELLA